LPSRRWESVFPALRSKRRGREQPSSSSSPFATEQYQTESIRAHNFVHFRFLMAVWSKAHPVSVRPRTPCKTRVNFKNKRLLAAGMKNRTEEGMSQSVTQAYVLPPVTSLQVTLDPEGGCRSTLRCSPSDDHHHSGGPRLRVGPPPRFDVERSMQRLFSTISGLSCSRKLREKAWDAWRRTELRSCTCTCQIHRF
jgi:hypothetical protein